jgi:hypothetical protein
MSINKLEISLSQYHETNKTWLFTEEFKDSGFIQEEIFEKYNEQLDSLNTDSIYLFEDLALYYLARTEYQVLNNSLNESIENMLSHSFKYAYLSIVKGSSICGCMELNPKLDMQRAGILFSQIIQSGRATQIEEQARH